MIESNRVAEKIIPAEASKPARWKLLSRLWAGLSSPDRFEDILIQDSFIHPELLTRF